MVSKEFLFAAKDAGYRMNAVAKGEFWIELRVIIVLHSYPKQS